MFLSFLITCSIYFGLFSSLSATVPNMFLFFSKSLRTASIFGPFFSTEIVRFFQYLTEKDFLHVESGSDQNTSFSNVNRGAFSTIRLVLIFML
jgi:hypothetical protein